ncbi:PREDICTED: uncharacterized protein LOC105449764 [Wasmannia auropunctata]|uniref:uncharacterized protein LOC105449764 n=1 Tax=Wasmannia auropunctata TaxID=64793 RepID=UPI0005EFF62D|nr:PREDICTED: uncharacterized protein LOC105449764 [Wasmannia auropunctata]
MKTEDKTIMLEDENEQTTNKITIRLPPFWPEEPELWFAQIETQFTLAQVTKDDERYAYALSKIEPKQVKEVKDVITRPPSQGKYETLKKALIQRLTDSQEQRIRKLFEEIGDRKPSQFLRHLTALAGATVSPELLRTLWLGRLPPQMQAILATRSVDDLEDVAEQVDHKVLRNVTLIMTEN